MLLNDIHSAVSYGDMFTQFKRLTRVYIALAKQPFLNDFQKQHDLMIAMFIYATSFVVFIKLILFCSNSIPNATALI